MKKPEIVYVHRGQIERRNGAGYVWREGYSEDAEGGVLYPWMTVRECQREAAALGSVARFKFIEHSTPGTIE